MSAIMRGSIRVRRSKKSALKTADYNVSLRWRRGSTIETWTARDVMFRVSVKGEHPMQDIDLILCLREEGAAVG